MKYKAGDIVLTNANGYGETITLVKETDWNGSRAFSATRIKDGLEQNAGIYLEKEIIKLIKRPTKFQVGDKVSPNDLYKRSKGGVGDTSSWDEATVTKLGDYSTYKEKGVWVHKENIGTGLFSEDHLDLFEQSEYERGFEDGVKHITKKVKELLD